MKKGKLGSRSEDGRRLSPQVSVPLSTAVTEVSVALRAGHVITAFGTLDVDLKTKKIREWPKKKRKKRSQIDDLQFFFHPTCSRHCIGNQLFKTPQKRVNAALRVGDTFMKIKYIVKL